VVAVNYFKSALHVSPLVAPILNVRNSESEVIQNHEKLLKHVAKTFASAGVPLEDLLQEGRLALVVAHRRWREEAAFWTYARPFVLEALCNAVKKARTDAAYCIDDPGTLEAIAYPAASPEDVVIAQDLLGALNARDRSFLLESVVAESSFEEIARRLGVGKSGAKFVCDRALAKMRKVAA
jgi:RNA polymerase sigma factor (sigma-70 family)